MVETASRDGAEDAKTSRQPPAAYDGINRTIESSQHLDKDSKVKLAHFSAKEHLVSDRIENSEAKECALDESRAHGFLGQSCFMYILHCYDNSTFSHPHNIAGYPLCKYAVRSGVGHQRCAPTTSKHAVARTSCVTTGAIYGTARRRGKFPRA
jgi:hypothetical protein